MNNKKPTPGTCPVEKVKHPLDTNPCSIISRRRDIWSGRCGTMSSSDGNVHVIFKTVSHGLRAGILNIYAKNKLNVTVKELLMKLTPEHDALFRSGGYYYEFMTAPGNTMLRSDSKVPWDDRTLMAELVRAIVVIERGSEILERHPGSFYQDIDYYIREAQRKYLSQKAGLVGNLVTNALVEVKDDQEARVRNAVLWHNALAYGHLGKPNTRDLLLPARLMTLRSEYYPEQLALTVIGSRPSLRNKVPTFDPFGNPKEQATKQQLIETVGDRPEPTELLEDEFWHYLERWLSAINATHSDIEFARNLDLSFMERDAPEGYRQVRDAQDLTGHTYAERFALARKFKEEVLTRMTPPLRQSEHPLRPDQVNPKYRIMEHRFPLEYRGLI